VEELANTDEKLAQAKQDLEDTRNSLTADQKFLMNLKETCQLTDQQWEERQRARQEEIQACSEALSILSSDDAHDTFTKTFNFMQVQEVSKRDAAAALLLKAAKKYGNPQLVALSTRVRLDVFAKVNAAIDDMVAALVKEKADDVKHKDFCVGGLHDNARAQELKSRDIDEVGAKIADLTSTIDEYGKSISQLQAEIAEMQKQMKRAGEDRELENHDFQSTIADQRETQRLLTSALNVLKAVYAKKNLMQTSAVKKQEPAGPPPPPGFGTYEKAGGAGGVLGMLEQIIADTKTLEKDAITAESDSQKAYEAFVKDTNKSIEEKNRDITSKTASKAQAESDKTASEEQEESDMNEQQMNKNEEADLHKSCDFTLQNFDIRQAALTQEVEALNQAKAILAGSKFTAFLQKH
jgi:hypothetical protein